MNSYFREDRNIELSTIYFIETQVATNWTGITVVKSFEEAYKVAKPIIAIELIDSPPNRREVGSTTLLTDYIIVFNIFAKSAGQRLDLASFLIDQLKDGWVYYTHSQTAGQPDTLTRSADGRIFVKEFTANHKLEFGGEGVDNYDKFRHYIEIKVRKSE